MAVTQRGRGGLQSVAKLTEELLFQANPQPMWVYDVETLAFLAANDAACKKYGYTRDEFLRMTIKDIRPPEDLSRLTEDVTRRAPSEVASPSGRRSVEQPVDRFEEGEDAHRFRLPAGGRELTMDGLECERLQP